MKSSALNVNTIILGFHQGSFFFPDPQEDMNPIVGIELWGVLVVFFFFRQGNRSSRYVVEVFQGDFQGETIQHQAWLTAQLLQ